MKKSICFYANKNYLPHLDVSLKSLRLVDKKCNIDLIAVTEENEIEYFKKYEKNYDLKLINFPKKKLIDGKINSIKLMIFDIIDSDVVVHYDADFVFRKPIPEWCESKKIKMVLGNSKGKQINKNKYYKIYSKLHEIYSKKEKINNLKFKSNWMNYNAGFFVASRRYHANVFNECKFLISQKSEYHDKIPNVIDQYVINYLLQSNNMIEEVSPFYNWHCKMKFKSEISAVHFANAHQDHLYSENSDFWPKEVSGEDLFRKLYV